MLKKINFETIRNSNAMAKFKLSLYELNDCIEDGGESILDGYQDIADKSDMLIKYLKQVKKYVENNY